MSEIRDAIVKAMGETKDDDTAPQGQPDSGAGPEASARDNSAEQVPTDGVKDPAKGGGDSGKESGGVVQGSPDAEGKTATGELKEGEVNPATEEKPAAPKTRAPASWKPEVRGEWDSLKPTVQQEVLRRDREVETVLRQSAEARRLAEDFNQTVRPFEAMIRAEGSEPLRAVGKLFETAALLRTGSNAAKAQAVASMVRDFGIDLPMLNDALLGTLRPPAEDPVMRAVDQRLKPLTDALARQQSSYQYEERQAAIQAQIEIDEFFGNGDDFPHAEDLREDIADVLELNARRGRKMSLQDAYRHASMAHPTISKLVEHRKVAESIAQQNAAAQKAKNTAASVKSAPSGSGGSEPEDDSIRGTLERVIGQVGGRV